MKYWCHVAWTRDVWTCLKHFFLHWRLAHPPMILLSIEIFGIFLPSFQGVASEKPKSQSTASTVSFVSCRFTEVSTDGKGWPLPSILSEHPVLTSSSDSTLRAFSKSSKYCMQIPLATWLQNFKNVVLWYFETGSHSFYEFIVVYFLEILESM